MIAPTAQAIVGDNAAERDGSSGALVPQKTLGSKSDDDPLFRGEAAGSTVMASQSALADRLELASASATAEDRWYEVKDHLHLGLSLRIGGCYTLADLQKRCQGHANKLAALERFTNDSAKLAETVAPPPGQLPLKRSSSERSSSSARGTDSSRRRRHQRLILGQVVWHMKPDERTRLARVVQVGTGVENDRNLIGIKYLDKSAVSAAGVADAAGGSGVQDDIVLQVPSEEIQPMEVHEITTVKSLLAPHMRSSVPASLVSAPSCPARAGMRINSKSSDPALAIKSAQSFQSPEKNTRSLAVADSHLVLPPEENEQARSAAAGRSVASTPIDLPLARQQSPSTATALAPVPLATIYQATVNSDAGSAESAGDSRKAHVGSTTPEIARSAECSGTSALCDAGARVSPCAVDASLPEVPNVPRATPISSDRSSSEVGSTEGATSNQSPKSTPLRRPCVAGPFVAGQVVWHVDRNQLPPWPAKIVAIDVLVSGTMYWIEHFCPQAGAAKIRVDAASIVPFSKGHSNLGYQLVKAAREAEVTMTRSASTGGETQVSGQVA